MFYLWDARRILYTYIYSCQQLTNPPSHGFANGDCSCSWYAPSIWTAKWWQTPYCQKKNEDLSNQSNWWQIVLKLFEIHEQTFVFNWMMIFDGRKSFIKTLETKHMNWSGNNYTMVFKMEWIYPKMQLYCSLASMKTIKEIVLWMWFVRTKNIVKTASSVKLQCERMTNVICAEKGNE